MIGSAVLGLLAITHLLQASQRYDTDALVKIAKDEVRSAVRGEFTKCEAVHPPRPVFVTIEVNGSIRGCRGSLQVRTKSLEEEVALAARGAAAHDPRYRPLLRSELSKFLVTVTVVESQVPISDVSTLRPDDGLVLQSGNRFGVVLPWEGKDPNVRLDWAFRKAGVSPGASVALFLLKASRFKG
jgi:AMMECR1 domain-containing protein